MTVDNMQVNILLQSYRRNAFCIALLNEMLVGVYLPMLSGHIFL